MPPPALPNAVLKGIAFMVIAMSLFAVVDGLSKLLVASLSFGQILLARFSVGFVGLVAFAGPSGFVRQLRTAWPGLQVARAICPLAVSVGMTVGLMFLPLAEATVFLFAGPFLIVALAGPLLGERNSWVSWLAVALGFTAVLIVMRPGFGGFSPATLIPLIAAVFYAFLQILTRKLSGLGESAMSILAWTMLIGVAVSLVFALADWRPMSGRDWLLAAALGLSFGLAQLFLTLAFRYTDASVLAPVSYSQLIAAVVFGFAVFGDVPDLWTIAGIGLIVVAGVLSVRQRPQ